MKLAHIGVHDAGGNIGDVILFKSVRDLFDKFIPGIEWHLYSLRGKYDRRVIDDLNKYDGIVLGGGGVIIKDTHPNNISGWQWICSIDNIRRIKVPIYVMSIGYNRFRGQEDFIPAFSTNISALIEKSAFFGVRNTGSKKALAKYIPSRLVDRVSVQPCPTTVLDRLHDFAPVQKTDRVAVNMAYDRSALRYDGKERRVMERIRSAAKRAGVDIVAVKHSPKDMAIPGTKSISLSGKPPKDAIDFYRSIPLTIGTRGHSQMIPFGVGNSIASLITHDKLKWFLEDIEHPEWGMEASESFEDWLVDRIHNYKQDIISNDKLWEMTCRNMDGIHG